MAEGGEHRLDNGLLPRSDVHTLVDRGYLAVDSRHRLLVSPRLREDFGNGGQFYARAGEVIELPERRPTGRTAASWNGTSMKSSRPRSGCPPSARAGRAAPAGPTRRGSAKRGPSGRRPGTEPACRIC